MPRREKHLASARERLASNMRDRRHAAGISQEVLAEMAGLHRTYIGAIERSERNVSIDNIEKIAIALNADVVNLLSPIGIKGVSS